MSSQAPREIRTDSGSAARADGDAVSLHYDRETPEFAWVANLSDAGFAIAMTLLVLTLEVPDGPSSVRRRRSPASSPSWSCSRSPSVWSRTCGGSTHKLVALFQTVEPGMVGLTLVLLGAVALVPFPTSLIGGAPTDRVAVLTFIGLFTLLSALFLLLVVRAHTARAFRDAGTGRHVYVMLGLWVGGIAVLLIAAAVTAWSPVGGLVILGLTIVLGPVAARGGAASQHRLIDRYLSED